MSLLLFDRFCIHNVGIMRLATKLYVQPLTNEVSCQYYYDTAMRCKNYVLKMHKSHFAEGMNSMI